MKKVLPIGALLIALMVLAPVSGLATEPAKPSGPQDILVVSGTITNAHGKPVKEVVVDFFINNHKVELEEETSTSKSGRYEAEIPMPTGTLPGARIEYEAAKPSYKSTGKITLEGIVKERTDEQGNTYYLAHRNLTLMRAITPAFWIATLILVAVYALIAFELMHRTLAAFLGAALLLTITYTAGTFNPDYVILTFEDAMHAMDMNVIFLLMAMMMIVGHPEKNRGVSMDGL